MIQTALSGWIAVSVYQVIEFTGDTKGEDNLIHVMFMCLVKSRRNVRKIRT